MANGITTDTFNQLIDNVIVKFYDTLQNIDSKYREYYDVETVTDKVQEDTTISYYGVARRQEELGAAYQDGIQPAFGGACRQIQRGD